jgi:hypothetical protein
VVQRDSAVIREPNKIGVSTPFDFEGHSLTAYDGLLPVATMLDKLGFQQLIEESLTIKRRTRAIGAAGFGFYASSRAEGVDAECENRKNGSGLMDRKPRNLGRACLIEELRKRGLSKRQAVRIIASAAPPCTVWFTTRPQLPWRKSHD